jgi:lipoprotein-releasing system permease protein
MFASSFIALKFIKSKKHSFLPSLSFFTSFFGVFISVFALITTISVMEGFKQEFQKNILGLRPHIKVYFLDENYRIGQFQDYKAKRDKVLDAGVVGAFGGLSGEVIASDVSGKRMQGIIINAIEEDGFYSRDLLKKGTVGNFKDGIVIGKEIAFNLGLALGDEINLISPQFRKTPFGSIPIHKTFKVSGIFDVGMHFYDSSFAFLNLEEAMGFFGKSGADYLEIMLFNPDNLDSAKQKISATFGGNVRITDWKTENRGFIQAIALQKSVMFFILLMFLLLASFIMFSSLSALVMQKSKTIAVLQTMGFSGKQVASTFFQVGLFTALPAILVGVLLGGAFVLKLEEIKNWLEGILNAKIFDGAYYFLSYIPSHLETSVILQVVFVSCLLCFVAILIPALKAIKTKPIEALRWE